MDAVPQKDIVEIYQQGGSRPRLCPEQDQGPVAARLAAARPGSRGLIVVTGNLREFGRVDGLRAEDWLGAPSSP